MKQLDVLCSRVHYGSHLAPVWQAFKPSLRGTWRTLEPPRGSGAGRAVLVSSASDLGMATRAGYSAVAYLEHGYGQSYSGAPGYPGGRGRGAVSLFLSPNDTAAAADRAAYPGARVAVVGDPALEQVPAREPGPPAIAVSFHWECAVAPESRSALAHYRRALPALAERYHVLGHGHPRAAQALERVWRRLGVEWVPLFSDVCRRADLYVCDTSSTLFEFASTGRPVVVLNAPWYRRDVEHGLRYWQAASVGVQVDHPGQLLERVALALEDGPAQQLARRAALRCVYARATGAAQAAAHELEEWLA